MPYYTYYKFGDCIIRTARARFADLQALTSNLGERLPKKVGAKLYFEQAIREFQSYFERETPMLYVNIRSVSDTKKSALLSFHMIEGHRLVNKSKLIGTLLEKNQDCTNSIRFEDKDYRFVCTNIIEPLTDVTGMPIYYDYI